MIWYWRITASIAGWKMKTVRKITLKSNRTPQPGEQITGVPRQYIETIAREFADTAHKTHGRSMIILGAGVNHWYHMDMNYRGMINMLIFCGCVGQSGGGWAHYVGEEKLRPQTGWLPLAFALDWNRPPRQMNSTSFFYNHSSQWRYEKSLLRSYFHRSPMPVSTAVI